MSPDDCSLCFNAFKLTIELPLAVKRLPCSRRAGSHRSLEVVLNTTSLSTVATCKLDRVRPLACLRAWKWAHGWRLLRMLGFRHGAWSAPSPLMLPFPVPGSESSTPHCPCNPQIMLGIGLLRELFADPYQLEDIHRLAGERGLPSKPCSCCCLLPCPTEARRMRKRFQARCLGAVHVRLPDQMKQGLMLR